MINWYHVSVQEMPRRVIRHGGGAKDMKQKLGLGFFVILSVLGVMGVFFLSTDTASLAQVADRINIDYLLLCIFVVPVVDWLIAGFRMWLFTRAVCPGISYIACVKNCVVGSFVGAATPSQAGGGIAQIYMLVKEGTKTGQAISILFMTFLSTLVFYALMSSSLWGLNTLGYLPDMGMNTPFALAAAMFVGLALVGILITANPQHAQHILGRFVAWAQTKKRAAIWATRLSTHLNDGWKTLNVLIRKHKLRFLLSVLTTIILFANKYLAAYLAIRALGLQGSLFELIIIQIFLHIMLYFFPTPGGSGAAEVGTAIMMQSLVPSALLPAYTLLWRTAIMYLSVLVGGLILVHYIRRKVSPDQ